MRHWINQLKTILKVSVIGALVGMLAAVGGLAIESWNVDHHGASYRSYQFHGLAFGALPGMLLAENRFGANFQLGEVQHHKRTVIGWNALIFASLGAWATLVFQGVGRHSSHATIIANKKQNRPKRHLRVSLTRFRPG